MKNSIKSKLLVMLTLGAACVSDVYASEWTGEDKPTGTTTYYLYNTVAGSWLGNNGSAAPTLGEAQYKIPFTVEITGKNNDDWSFRYTYKGSPYFLSYQNRGGTIYKQEDKVSVYFGVNASNDNASNQSKTYYIGTKQKVDLIGLDKKYFYLYYNENNHALGFTQRNDPLYEWQLISPDQYSSRPQLDALITEIGETSDPELLKALKAAQDALDGNSGAAMKVAVGNLTAAYTKNNARMKELWSLLLTTETLLTDLRSLGIMLPNPYTYDYILGLHDTALGVYNTQALRSPIEEDAIDEQVSILNRLIQAIGSDYLTYCKAMRDLVLPLGYDIPRGDINEMVSKIMAYKQNATSTNRSACDDKVEDVRTNFKSWVRTNNVVFPSNSDLTAYIKNHSFDLNNYQNWNVKGTNPTCTSVDLENKDGNNYLTCSSGDITISQPITGLPAGKYRLEAWFATDKAGTLSAGGTDGTIIATNDQNSLVKSSVEFTTDGSSDITISAKKGDGASYFKVDNFRLYFVKGGAPLTFKESSTTLPTYVAGVYPNIEMTRTIYTDNDWNTLCLPFSLTADETSYYFRSVRSFSGLNKDDGGNYLIVYEETDHIEAGVPYLVKGNEERGVTKFTQITAADKQVIATPLDPVMEFKNVNGETEAMLMMQGNFMAFNNTEGHKITCLTTDLNSPDASGFVYTTYLLQSNSKFRWIDSNSVVNMQAFRAYFHLATKSTSGGNTPAAPTLRIVLSEELDNSTGIEALPVSTSSTICFDLNGRQVAPNANGLKIKNNKIYFVK